MVVFHNTEDYGREKMGSAVQKDMKRTELATFMKEVRENFMAAGKPKPTWFGRIVKILLG